VKPSFVVLEVNCSGVNGTALYDPGANASIITQNALKKLKDAKYVPLLSTYNTTNGQGSILGITMQTLQINEISTRVPLYVIHKPPNFKYDFIIGLDLIPTFKLLLDHNLEISQNNVTLNIEAGNEISINSNEIWNDYMSYDLFLSKTKHLDHEKQTVIRNLIMKNNQAFAKSAFDVGNVNKYECSINLNEDIYVAKKPYRCTFEDQQEIERRCSELLKAGMITHSQSPFASPVTMQYKKDGLSASKNKTRMCPDYRELNRALTPESQLFPLISDILIKTQGCSWFSAIDINAAFWSIPLKESDRHKSAFVTQSGHYEWCCMPFGIKTAPAVFQRVLSGILRRKEFESFCVNYLDDVLIYSHSFNEHVKHLQMVISAIYEEGFKLNFKKCNFATSSIQYLGHIIEPNTVRPLQDNLVAINSFPIPSSRKNICQFLGKVNFYRKFIPKSTSLLEPLHNLLRKNTPFSWTSECQASFDKIKELLTSAPVLAVFDREKPISPFIVMLVALE